MRNNVKIKYFTFLNRVKENYESSAPDNILKKLQIDDINKFNVNLIKLIDDFLIANEFSLYELQEFCETDCMGIPFSYINENINLNDNKTLTVPIGQIISNIYYNASKKMMILQLVDLLRDLFYERERLISNS